MPSSCDDLSAEASLKAPLLTLPLLEKEKQQREAAAKSNSSATSDSAAVAVPCFHLAVFILLGGFAGGLFYVVLNKVARRSVLREQDHDEMNHPPTFYAAIITDFFLHGCEDAVYLDIIILRQFYWNLGWQVILLKCKSTILQVSQLYISGDLY